MRLLDKLEKLFTSRIKIKTNGQPSLLDRLGNVFYAAEFLKADLQRLPPFCNCEDAIAHLEGRCRCTKPAAERPSEAAFRKGCLAHLETLRLDVRSLRESLDRHRGDLRPEERTEELQRELALIEQFADRVGSIVDEIANHAVDFGLRCSNDALQKLRQSGPELEKYSTELFWSLMREERLRGANSAPKANLTLVKASNELRSRS